MSLRRSSLDRERVVGTDGERAMGVFLRETLESMSHIVENGIRFFASSCQQSQIRSCDSGECGVCGDSGGYVNTLIRFGASRDDMSRL